MTNGRAGKSRKDIISCIAVILKALASATLPGLGSKQCGLKCGFN